MQISSRHPRQTPKVDVSLWQHGSLAGGRNRCRRRFRGRPRSRRLAWSQSSGRRPLPCSWGTDLSGTEPRGKISRLTNIHETVERSRRRRRSHLWPAPRHRRRCLRSRAHRPAHRRPGGAPPRQSFPTGARMGTRVSPGVHQPHRLRPPAAATATTPPRRPRRCGRLPRSSPRTSGTRSARVGAGCPC